MEIRSIYYSSVFIIIVALTIHQVDCVGEKNVLLFFPGGTFSHVLGIWPYAVALADKGFNVTVFCAHKKPPSTHPKITLVTPKLLVDFMTSAYHTDRFEDRRLSKEFEIWDTYHDITASSCELLLDPKSRGEDPDLDSLLDSQFDLVIVNAVYGDCGFIFAHHYKTKYILNHAALPSEWFADSFGFPLETHWLPNICIEYKNYPLSLWDRILNTLSPLYWMYRRQTEFFPRMEKIMKKHLKLDYMPKFEEMERNSSLVFINSNPAVDFARSLPPQFIPIGGMQLWLPEKPIPKIFNEFLNTAGKEGAILISFGSSVELSTVPEHYQSVFLNLVRKNYKIKFIMKWKGSLPEKFKPVPKNLLISEWLPQKEILRHPKLSAFITHGGLNSVQESTFHAVPLIVVPLFADQDFNAYRITVQELGVSLEIRELTDELVQKAVDTILSNPKYKKNMVMKSKLFRDVPRSPIETAVYWTEFVLRHDMTGFKPMMPSRSWWQARLLDVYAVILTTAVVVLILIYLIFIKIFKLILSALVGGSRKEKQSYNNNNARERKQQ